MVLDVGVGDKALSTKTLIELGAKVVAIDSDRKCLMKQKNLCAMLAQCDASQLPFGDSIFGLAVAFFTLHETNPSSHHRIVSEMARIARNVMIVEPMPNQDAVNRKYDDIWSRAMHEIDRFEDYRELGYWENLLRECNLRVTVCEELRAMCKIPPEKIGEFIKGTVAAMGSYGVPKKYVKELEDLENAMKIEGMRLSDRCVVMGQKIEEPLL